MEAILRFIKKQQLNEIKKDAFAWFTTIVDDDDFEILKAGWHSAITRYGKERQEAMIDIDFWKKYAGLSDEQSREVNKVLTRVILSQQWIYKTKVIEKLMKLGIDEKKAIMIATTELANMANKARELAYKRRTKVKKFIWVTEKDDRVCEKCKEVERLTSNGVSLDELRKIIKRVGGESSREYTVHPQCRCTFTRYLKDKRHLQYWEKKLKQILTTKFIKEK